jgi:hypothetical protein
MSLARPSWSRTASGVLPAAAVTAGRHGQLAVLGVVSRMSGGSATISAFESEIRGVERRAWCSQALTRTAIRPSIRLSRYRTIPESCLRTRRRLFRLLRSSPCRVRMIQTASRPESGARAWTITLLGITAHCRRQMRTWVTAPEMVGGWAFRR